MAGLAAAQIPFNFFAGSVPDAPVDLAWTTGYLYVITSVVVFAPNGSDTEEFLLIDASGNRRVHATIGPTGDYAMPFLNMQCEMVMGPNSGALLYATGVDLFCSVDGYAFAPVGSTVW